MGQLLEELTPEERITIVERAFRSHMGRRRTPKFWRDEQVRRLLITEFDKETLDGARQKAIDLLGEARAPSRSSIQRFWHSLDQFWRIRR